MRERAPYHRPGVLSGVEAEAPRAQISLNTSGKRSKAVASKDLGTVIERLISDGAFRRQLQSDPAAALRGFNLTPNEVAAIRSGDASRLTALGVDQRVSKMFTIGTLSGTRAAISDMGTGATSNASVEDPTLAGTRGVIHDVPPFGTTGTSAVEDPSSPEYAATQHAADLSGTRPVHDVPPFGTTRTSAIEDATSPEFSVANRMAELSSADATRAIHDVAPFDGDIVDAHDLGTSGVLGGGGGNTES